MPPGDPAPARSKAAVALVAVVLTLVGASPRVAAQEPSDPIEQALLTLEGMPFWYGPGHDLDLRIRVTNPSASTITGFRLSIAAYDRAQTRFGLAASETLDPTTTPLPSSAFSRDFDRSVPPGDSVVVLVDEPIETLPTLAGSLASGVYPLTVTLLDNEAVIEGPTLPLPSIFYPGEVEPALDLVTVVPLNDLPAQGPDGLFAAGDSGSNPLEEAIADGGWLRGVISALQARAGKTLSLSLAPSPRLVDELADMADGYTRGTRSGPVEIDPSAGPASSARVLLEDIRDVLARRGTQPMLAPYGWVDLPALARFDLEPLAEQLAVGERALAALETAVTRRWILAPLGRVDEVTLERLADTSPETAGRLIFSSTSLIQPDDPALAGCPAGSPTFTCPVAVEAPTGRVAGFQVDARLQDHLATMSDPGLGRLGLQRLLAETSMIREELPGRAGRVVTMVLPASLHMDPRLAHVFFKSLSQAPWLRMVTPNRALAEAAEIQPRDLIDILPTAPQDPGAGYYDAVDRARETVETFASTAPPPPLLERLRRDILVAYGRHWWESEELIERGLGFAEAARDEALDHLDSISVLNVPEITLTSRRGEIQLLVANENDFPVSVSIHLTSLNLELDGGGVVNATFPASKTTQVAIGATAQKSGIFPVEVSVRTPDGDRTIFGPQTISIRSTELNRIAVGITFGAFAFLVSFYVFRSVRRKRRDPPSPDTTTLDTTAVA